MARLIFAFVVTFFLLGQPAEASVKKKMARIFVYYPAKVVLVTVRVTSAVVAVTGGVMFTGGVVTAVNTAVAEDALDRKTRD